LFRSSISQLVVRGGAGNDTIDAHEAGVPVALFGEAGNDWLQGGRFSDLLVGGKGNDRLFGDRGDDLIVGGLGKDELHSRFGNDLLVGGSVSYESSVQAMSAL